jgi:hypothetical protein
VDVVGGAGGRRVRATCGWSGVRSGRELQCPGPGSGMRSICKNKKIYGTRAGPCGTRSQVAALPRVPHQTHRPACSWHCFSGVEPLEGLEQDSTIHPDTQSSIMGRPYGSSAVAFRSLVSFMLSIFFRHWAPNCAANLTLTSLGEVEGPRAWSNPIWRKVNQFKVKALLCSSHTLLEAQNFSPNLAHRCLSVPSWPGQL